MFNAQCSFRQRTTVIGLPSTSSNCQLPSTDNWQLLRQFLYKIILNILVTFLNAREWISGDILLNKEMLHPCFLCFIEYFFEIDNSISYFGKGFFFCLIHILHMPKRKTSGMLIKKPERIMVGLCDPVNIHFKFYQFWICFLQQDFISMLAVHINEFKIVIMVSKLDPGFFTFCSSYCKFLSNLFIIIDRFPFILIQMGDHHIFLTCNQRIRYCLIPLGP